MRRPRLGDLGIALVVTGVALSTTRRAAAEITSESLLRNRPPPPVWVVSPPPPQPAPPPPPADRPADEDEYGVHLESYGLEVSVGTIMVKPSLGKTVFSGTGTPLNGSERIGFRHDGRELGLGSPTLLGGELQAHYLRRYFAVGISGYIVKNTTGADASPSPANNVASSQVDQAAMIGYGGGIDLTGAIPIGSMITLRPGAVLGVRGLSVPLSGFEKKTCHDRHNNPYPCDEDATSGALFVVEPRLTVLLSPTPHGDFFFGGYIGTNVLDGSPTAGIFIGMHTPHSTLRP